MKTVAAVLVELGRPLELCELELPTLRPGQVLVEIAYSGVCHTQVLEARGRRGPDDYVPHCLGHEGSGVVRDIGTDVTRVQPGDRVILSWIKGGGLDVPGTVYEGPSGRVNAGGVTTFQTFSVVSENRLTRLPDGVPMREAALLGCAAPTGIGAVWHAGNVRRGQTVAVFGVGGVGLCAVAAAAERGAEHIVAIDRRADRLNCATQLGATDTINVDDDDAFERLKACAPGGFDAAIEATGRPSVMRQALECVRPRGGRAVVIGNAPHGESLSIDPQQLNQGKQLLGTWGGDSEPDRDYAGYASLIAIGRLDLSPLVGATYTLDQINQALDDLESGRVVRPMVEVNAIGSCDRQIVESSAQVA